MSGPALGPAPDVAWTSTVTGGVAVARVPSGPPYVLDGSAAVIWTAVAEDGGADGAAEVVQHVARATGQPAKAIEPDVLALLAVLEERGLVAYSSSSPSR